MNLSAARTLSDKLVRELFRIAQAYGKEHPFRFEDLANDFAAMLETDCLQIVSLKFHRNNASRDVLVEYNYSLHAGAPRFHLDDAQGIGIVPLSPPFEMQLVIHRDLQRMPPANRLRLNWGDAPVFAHGQGYAHQDGNTARRTGGQATKQVYMDNALRRQGRVKFFLPDRQYGFIAGSDGVDVFFHANNAPTLHPRPGQQVSYLPMVTPRGVQAKDVRAA